MRITYICACAHKERSLERCIFYQMRKDGSWFTCCLPACKTERKRIPLQRVCRDCRGYFFEKFGRRHYQRFIEHFLSYKGRMGWASTAIDPKTIPREVLVNRNRGQGDREDREGRGHGQPFQVHQPMQIFISGGDDEAAAGRTEKINDLRQGTPYPHTVDSVDLTEQGALEPDDYYVEEIPSRPEQVSGPGPKRAISPYFPWAPGTTMPMPMPIDHLGKLFVVGDFADEDDEEGGMHLPSPSPILANFPRLPSPAPEPKYGSKTHARGLVVPELAHLATRAAPRRARAENQHQTVVQEMRSRPELQHPQPKIPKLRHAKPERVPPRVLKQISSFSPVSLVRRLGERAENIEIPNYQYVEYKGNLVPVLRSPPEGGRGGRRQSSPIIPMSASSPNSDEEEELAGILRHPRAIDVLNQPVDIAIDAHDVPDTLVPGANHDNGDYSPSSFVTTEVIPPPRRLSGILIPSASGCCAAHGDKYDHGCVNCRGSYFRERGLPSDDHIEECRSATLTKTPMVSVKTPKRRYSCAVQSCYCDDEGKSKGEKCLSCQERDEITRNLKMGWV
jgi:hypothetical protein